jgi:hypothetical protein
MATSADVQTQSAKTANTPTTLTGCLKAGEADGLLVLMTARTEGNSDAATYQLVGDQVATMRDHIGRRVEVKGIVQAEQEVASRSTAKPEERPTGTAGAATVQTRTEIEIKQLAVTEMKPIDEKCE